MKTASGVAENPAGGAIARRMRNQGLWQPVSQDIAGVLHGMVGMQAQEFQYALWSVAQRIAGPGGSSGADRAHLLRAFDEGVLLRTHVLRPTWHFALPADVRWLLRLTAPRLRRLIAYYNRRAGLDAAELVRARAVLARATDGGRHRTRRELAEALESAGITSAGLRLGFILMHAEYDEVLISGAMRGKQQTYAAFDERVPAGAGYDEEAALAELARRYVAGRGPVTAKDLATWASLTLTQARSGLAAVEADCVVTELAGLTMWSAASSAAAPPADRENARTRCPVVDLVQGYDEIVMSYSESRGLLTGGLATLPVADRSTALHAVLVDGVLAGHWRHRLGRDSVHIEIELLRALTAAERAALGDAAGRYGQYLGVPAVIG